MLNIALFALLPLLAKANPVEKRWTAASYAGSATSDIYPPSGMCIPACGSVQAHVIAQANSALFPGESQVGYPGATQTGIEPAAIETAGAYAYNNVAAARFPLITDEPFGDAPKSHAADNLCTNGSQPFETSKYWGNLSPWYSVPSSAYGLPDASPAAPQGCSITQVHLLYRHGARYPTSGAAPATFAQKVHNATMVPGGFGAEGDLAFLNQWTYGLGAELLTPFGRLQNFELGVAFRQQYGYLLNNFTKSATIPVFRTESQDRMVKTAENFAAGFFGVPEYVDQVNIEIMIEAKGINNTGASYETCTNSNVASRGYIGSTVATAYANNAFNSTLSRLNSLVHGITFTPTDAIAMLQLCAYETDALGYSSFCGLFTEADFAAFEYYFDLSFYYSQGPGSPVSAAQGKGWVEELLARFQHHYITVSDSNVNTTLDSNPTYFPLNQSIYADATHEVIVMDIVTALNLTNVYTGGPLDPNMNAGKSSFRASQVVPFATHLVVQVMECQDTVPTKQARFILNDAVVPPSYAGCAWDKYGRCAFDTVVKGLTDRVNEIDFNYDCFANYTALPGMDYNGRAPRS